MEKRHAPFTPAEVASINEYQTTGILHPFTCLLDHAGSRVLVADENGLRCPVCRYYQTWVHAMMADGSWYKAASALDQMFASKGMHIVRPETKDGN